MAYIDPCEVSPDNYTLRHETDGVKVIEMWLPAGEKDIEHSHHNEFVYFITGGKARVHVGGDAVDLEIPDGHFMEHEPWTHVVENVGDTDIHAIIFELKPQ